MKTSLQASRLRELLHYDPETGVFTWRCGRQGVRAVKKLTAGGPDGQGYIRIKVDGTYYGAHRLAFLYVLGALPAGHVDHIDGVRTNNRFANLRDVRPQVNSQNQRRATKRSRTGLLGVSAPTYCRKTFRAEIKVSGLRIVIGEFGTADAAHEAYVAKKRALHEGCTL